MNICTQCGKSGERLWLTNSGLCEKCAWKVYQGLGPRERAALSRGISPLEPGYEEKLAELGDVPLMPASAPSRKPLYKRWWLYAILAVVFAAVAFLLLSKPADTPEDEYAYPSMDRGGIGGGLTEDVFSVG